MKKENINNNGLNILLKILIGIFSFYIPLVTPGILYFGLRKRYPIKAKEALKIGMIMFFVELFCLLMVYGFLVYKHGVW